MKRARQETDSFDLFLDTICNTFGGIVFISILLAILLQIKGANPTPAEIKQPVDPTEIRLIIQAIDKMASRRQEISAAIAAMGEPRDTGSDPKYNDAASKLEENRKRLADLHAEMEKETKKTNELLRESAEINEENQQVSAQLAALEEAVNEQEKALEEALDEKTERLRLPRIRQQFGGKCILLCWMDKVYVAKTPNGDFFTEHVTFQAIGGSGVRVRAKNDQGWTIDEVKATTTIELSDYLDEVAGENGFVKIAVWPDSHAAFQVLKNELVARQIRYELWVLGSDEPLELGTSSRPSAVQ